MRWDRLGRVAMRLVMLALLYLYVSAGISLLSTWQESKRDNAQVASMELVKRQLEQQHAALTSQGTLAAEARRLGMMRPGEQVYMVRGLPPN